jgi:hypothetical protein
VGFFYTLASGILLSNQQIKSRLLRKVNSFFINLAKRRTESLFFGLPIDRHIYEIFYRTYFKWDTYARQRREGVCQKSQR